MSESLPIDCLTPLIEFFTPPIDMNFVFEIEDEDCKPFDWILDANDFLTFIDCSVVELPKFLDNFSNGSLFYVIREGLGLYLIDYLRF
jgi:hypothetical protein